MIKRYVYFFLLLLLLTDLTYSFFQHLSMSLDGDMASGIVPAEDVKRILRDPFGISVVTENAKYPNPNRFFAHWTFYNYFNYVPLLLQKIVSPIESVYLASAIAKTLIQLLITTLIALCITGKRKITSLNFVLAAILVVPLFQTNGYRTYMSVIDATVTYSFFYALPTVFLLLFYFPFFHDSIYGSNFLKRKLTRFLLLFLSIFIVFNGALNPGIILTVTLLFLLNYFLKTNKNLSISKRVMNTFQLAPKTHLFYFSFISLLSVYALLIGLNNTIFNGETITVAERYLRLPIGIFYVVTGKIGFPILLAVIALNIFLLRKIKQNESVKKALRIFNWIGLFILFYILLLPLGGYKSYRPNILRYDTIIPVTLCLIFMYAMSSYLLLKQFKGKSKVSYILLIIGFSFIFTYADKPEFNKNKEEKIALVKIANSKDKIVFIEQECTVLTWDKITDPNDSKLNGELLYKWGITKEEKRYFQKE